MTDADLPGEDGRGAEETSTDSRAEKLEDPWRGIPATLLDGPSYHIDRPAGEGRGAEETSTDSRAEKLEDPWRGIPATLLDGPSYDVDSAGDRG